MTTGITGSRIRLQSRVDRISLATLMTRSISHRYISHRTVQGIRILEEIIITETDSAITTAATEIMTVIITVVMATVITTVATGITTVITMAATVTVIIMVTEIMTVTTTVVSEMTETDSLEMAVSERIMTRTVEDLTEVREEIMTEEILHLRKSLIFQLSQIQEDMIQE